RNRTAISTVAGVRNGRVAASKRAPSWRGPRSSSLAATDDTASTETPLSVEGLVVGGPAQHPLGRRACVHVRTRRAGKSSALGRQRGTNATARTGEPEP